MNIANSYPASWAPVAFKARVRPVEAPASMGDSTSKREQPRQLAYAEMKREPSPIFKQKHGADIYEMHSVLGVYPHYVPGAILNVQA